MVDLGEDSTVASIQEVEIVVQMVSLLIVIKQGIGRWVQNC